LAPARHGLSKSLRLLAPRDFAAVMKHGLRSRDEYFSIAARPNGLGHARLGLAISRRAAAAAVTRNRLKRQVRESFRHMRNGLASVDLVVMAQPAAAHAPGEQLRASLNRHWERITKQCRESSFH
jgi:ribonuclease P protein component